MARTIAQASSMPRSPVQALALPLLTRIARKECERSSWSRSTRTGAAWTLFVVNTAAPAAGEELYTSARSFFTFLMPQ